MLSALSHHADPAATGRMLMQMLGSLADLEKEMIREGKDRLPVPGTFPTAVKPAVYWS